MTFPAVPRDTAVELFLGGVWVDVTGDVRADPGIDIDHGRANESSEPHPSTCTLAFDNRSGNYSPRNPVGAYFGQLGRNNPIQVSINLARDTFTRTVSDGWGAADTGQVWTVGGGPASDYNVSGGVGRQSLPSTGVRSVTLALLPQRDVDVTVKVLFPFADVTGGSVSWTVLLRRQPNGDDYQVEVLISTTEVVSLRLWKFVGAAFSLIGSTKPVLGLTYSGQALRVRVQTCAQTVAAKVWVASGAEPDIWHNSWSDTTILAAGLIGLRTDIYSGNTNTFPVVSTFDDLVVRSPRFAGEVSSWPQSWDISGNDVTAPIEAAGISRRLGQGVSPVQSTLYRATLGLVTPPVAYWPCEDGPDSGYISSAIGGPPMIVTGTPTYAAFDGIPSSKPIPTLGNSSWLGYVPFYSDTDKVQLRFVVNFPTGGLPNNSLFIDIRTDGLMRWQLHYRTGGVLAVELWRDGVQQFDEPINFGVDGKNMMISLELAQNGSAIDWAIRTLEVGQSVGLFFATSAAGQTLRRAVSVFVAPFQDVPAMSLGQITVRKEITNLYELADELNGHRRETALNRFQRLADENDVPRFVVENLSVDSVRMGPQRPLSLNALLTECAGADLGTMHDSRATPGLVYRERAALYNQPDVLTLNYAGGQVAPPFQPTDDDQLTRNDVTATRLDGGSSRAELVTGRMSVLDPSAGGVGRYDTEVTVNVARDQQLDDIAGWLLHLGTVDETRYPQVRIDLANPATAGDTALAQAALDLNVDDRFTVINPKVGQTPDPIVQIARGYSEHISVFEHSLTINAAPGTPFDVLKLVAGRKLSAAGSTLAAGVTATATSLSVASTGTLWATAAGQMPIPITIGGERMTVTAVTGTSSPQAFTVTRSANGVVKAHPTGAPVALTQRATLAL